MPVISGKCKWARVFESNRDFGFQEDGQYNVTLELTPEAEAQLKADGIVLTYTENGPEYAFRRNHVITKDGTSITLGPPKVVDDDLKPFGTDRLIGNGSEVEILYNVYTPTKGKAKGKTTGKLEAVRVVNLVEYTSEKGSNSGFKPRATAKPLNDALPDELGLVN